MSKTKPAIKLNDNLKTYEDYLKWLQLKKQKKQNKQKHSQLLKLINFSS